MTPDPGQQADAGLEVASCDAGSSLVNGQCTPPPAVGVSCASQFLACESTTSALECAGSTWVAVHCRGPGGCLGMGTCDLTLASVGDYCPAFAEGGSACTLDALGMVQCRNHLFVKTFSCSSCTISDGLARCVP